MRGMTQEPEVDFEQVRAGRFGTLPERIRPADAVETVQTESAPGRPAAAPSEAQTQALLAGG
jgi:hypothetical protein